MAHRWATRPDTGAPRPRSCVPFLPSSAGIPFADSQSDCPLPEESYFVYGDGIDFSNTIKTCTAVFTVAVLIRIGRQASAACVASLLSIAGAVSLMIW
jgi:hypothetical protein